MKNSRSRTRRIVALLVAAVAILAVAPGAASAKTKVIHADVGVWMQYQPAGNGVGTAFIFGGVSTDRKVCKDNTIQIAQQRNNDPNTWDYVWGFEDVTKQGGGGFTRYLSPSDTGNAQYTAWVAKKVVKKPGKKIICSYGDTPDLLYAN